MTRAGSPSKIHRVSKNPPRVAVGVSHETTPHVLRAEGREHFVCCAVDLLLNRDLVSVEGRTRCPSCGARILVTLDAGALTEVVPTSAQVFAVEVEGPDGRVQVCCEDSAIFDSMDCLREWVAQRPKLDGVARSVKDYFRGTRVEGSTRETPM